MKNCLVIAGEYRTFTRTGDSILHFAKLNNLDIFCHLWTDDEKEVNEVKEKLNPVSIKWDSPGKFIDEFIKMEKRIRYTNPKGPNQDKVWQNASMNYSRKMAYESVPSGVYENIVFARYDLLFLSPFIIEWNPTGIATSVAESWGLISDVFAVMPSIHAPHFFLYDEYERLHSTPFEKEFIEFLRKDFNYGEKNILIHRRDRYCPHMILIRNFFLNKVPWCLAEFPVALQR